MKWILVSLCFLASAPLFCQYLYFKQVEGSTEILKNKPSQLFRHKNGLLYISTDKGLVSWDGKKYNKILNPDTLAHVVTSFFQDDQVLWLGHEDGSIYQYSENQATHWEHKDFQTDSKITAIIKDALGQLWVSTYGSGIFVYDHTNVHRLHTDDGLPSDDIYDMVLNDAGQVLVATDAGLMSCSVTQGKKIVKQLHVQPQIDRGIILDLEKSVETSIFYARVYDFGLCKVDTKNNTATLISGSADATYIFKSNHQGIYCIPNTQSTYVEYLQNGTVKQQKFQIEGLKSPLAVISMHLDDEGLIWLLCQNHGLLVADSHFKVEKIPSNNIQAVISVHDTLFLGNDQGLYKYFEGLWQQILPRQNIISLYYDKITNQLWAGTYGKGIFILNLDNQKIRTITEKKGLSNNNVFGITKTKDAFWVAGLAGIDQLDLSANIIKRWNRKSGFPTDYNYTILADKQDNLWVGSDGKGIVKIDAQQQVRQYLGKQSVTSLEMDEIGRLWFSTLDEGIGYIFEDSLNWIPNTKMKAWPATAIKSNRKGILLAFYKLGIEGIHQKTGSVIDIDPHLGSHQWIQNINAAFADNSGQIIATEGNKIITIIPLDSQYLRPKLLIKHALLGNKTLSQHKVNVVNHESHDFQVEFTGIWMRATDAVKYRYKLYGIDKDWRYTQDQKLIYISLPPGSYHFELQCSLDDQFLLYESSCLDFVIEKPFWRTWYFYVAMFIFALGVLYTWSKIIQRRSRQIQEFKTNQIKAELEVLKSQINPHFLFNSFNTLISTIEKKPQQAVIYVEKLSDFYRNMLQYRDQDLISLEEELLLLENYHFLLKQRFSDNIQLNIDVPQSKSVMIIPLTLQLLTENAVKHNIASAQKPLYIKIYVDQNQLVVSNNLQERITQEKSSHFGLQSLSKRYIGLTGLDIQIQKTTSIFNVIIPLIKYDKDRPDRR